MVIKINKHLHNYDFLFRIRPLQLSRLHCNGLDIVREICVVAKRIAKQ
jgi:hypothetical protein